MKDEIPKITSALPSDQHFVSTLLAQMQEKLETAQTDFERDIYRQFIIILEKYIPDL